HSRSSKNERSRVSQQGSCPGRGRKYRDAEAEPEPFRLLDTRTVKSLFAVVATIHAVLAHLLDQGGAPNAQPLRRARHNPAGILERLVDEPLLEVAQVLLQVQSFG